MKKHITKVLLSNIIMGLVFIGFLLLQTSCQQEVKKSILILSFDQLSPEKLNCSDERTYESSGFSIICKESIRFTHAYTTSLQPAAAMASILTGEYPLVHGVHRSFDRLKAEQKTVTEFAYKAGYRTSFFGGTPHILKKTGLSKYFELFDDSAGAQYSQQIIKDFRSTSNDFVNWASEEKSAFFSVLTNAEIEAFNDKDTNLSSYEKLDEKLYQFIIKLKEDHIWENSYIIILGLKGTNNYNRIEETSYTNLHSENTRISLFIKPPRMKGDEGVSWKVDDIVNLNDIGFTLKKMLKSNDQNKIEGFSNIDLNNYILMEKSLNNADRNIIIETANTWVANANQIKFAILNSKFLGIEKNNNFEFYNLLLDSFERSPLNIKSNDSFEELQDLISQIKKDYKIAEYTNSPNFLKKILDKDDLRNYKFNPREHKILNESTASCSKLINDKNISIEKLKSCTDSLFLEYLKTKHYEFYGISSEKALLNYEIAKKKYFEDLKIYKLNFTLENIWGLYNSEKPLFNGLMLHDPTFLN